jgi:predicted O-methyltransferase YrrM
MCLKVYQPDGLSERSWKLILGDARRESPKLLASLRQIDVIFHDSLATYECMMFEFIIAYKHLRFGGLLISDNVDEYRSLALMSLRRGKHHRLLSSASDRM